MDQATLNEILRKHRLWVKGDPSGKRADLRGADLEDANLRGADLRCADLEGANLEGTDLKNADLVGTDLECADLRCADLTGANLKDARLEGTNLDSIDLKHANLEGVNLKNTILTQTNTQNTKGQKVISIQVDTSRINNAISYWKDLGIWTTGCFQGTLEELQEKVAEAHKDNTFLRKRYERVIKFILSEADQDDKNE